MPLADSAQGFPQVGYPDRVEEEGIIVSRWLYIGAERSPDLRRIGGFDDPGKQVSGSVGWRVQNVQVVRCGCLSDGCCFRVSEFALLEDEGRRRAVVFSGAAKEHYMALRVADSEFRHHDAGK